MFASLLAGPDQHCLVEEDEGGVCWDGTSAQMLFVNPFLALCQLG